MKNTITLAFGISLLLTNSHSQTTKIREIGISQSYYGSSHTLNGGLALPVVNKIKAGLELVFPVYNRMRKDIIFKENPDEYHGVNFSIGASINLTCNLN